ncbi:MAG: hypothetical protein OXG18_09325, partial [Gemmatimonadetes bacterium]|nr:hypothetical protein [Gemmatimonadota bacterium]
MTAVPETTAADDRISHLGGVSFSEHNLRRRGSGDTRPQRIQIALAVRGRIRGFALRCFLGEWLRHAPREAP